jgi:polyhydroxyalkanoate synthesis regulator phasin
MAEKRDFSDVPYLVVGSVVAVQEEIEKAAERLVEKGKSLTPEGRKKMASTKKGLVSKGDDFSHVVARTVQRALENTGIVTHSDLKSIEDRVTVIEKRVSTRERTPAKAAKPAKPAARKAPAKKKAVAKKKAAGKKAASKPAAAAQSAAPPEPGPVLSELVPRRPAQ